MRIHAHAAALVGAALTLAAFGTASADPVATGVTRCGAVSQSLANLEQVQITDQAVAERAQAAYYNAVGAYQVDPSVRDALAVQSTKADYQSAYRTFQTARANTDAVYTSESRRLCGA